MNETTPCILLVDDNPENLNVLLDVMDESHYDVRIAKDGKTALEIVAVKQPDLILLDVMMPNMNGFEVCSRLKADKQTRNIPVIFMTVLNETVNKMRGYELGAVDYITKPINISEVLIRINTHLSLSRLRKQEEEIQILKSHFSSMTTHNLRIPLDVISGLINYLKQFGDRLTDEEKQKKYDMITDAVRKMTSVVDTILVHTRATAGKIGFYPEKTNIVLLCRNTASEFQTLIQGSHEISFSSEEDDICAAADSNLIWHVIINLLTNAVNFSPSGSKIDFRVFSEGNTVVLHIRDQGIGIPKSDQKRIFDAFIRGGNIGRIKGAGLGLTIVKAFVDLHNGAIELESEKGQGCLVKVSLPKEQSA